MEEGYHKSLDKYAVTVIDGIELRRTNARMPEHYYAFKDDAQLASIHMKRGVLLVEAPDAGDKVLLEVDGEADGSIVGYGMFTDAERDVWLQKAVDVIRAHYDVALELVDGAVYGIGFMDDGDQARHDSRLRAAHHVMDSTLRSLQGKSPGAHWREPPKVERIGDKVQITARLALAGHG